VNLLEAFERVAEQLIKPDEEPKKIAEGFVFTEGPVWSFSGSHLTFVDLAGNAMYRYSEEKGAVPYRDPSDYANGLAYDGSGRLLSCEHRTRRITIESDGGLDVVVDSFRGRKLNAPNDLVIADDGSVVFTDPHYGLTEGYGGPGEQEQPHRGVYRLPPGADEPELLVDDLEGPNGLALTRDEKVLYVADSEHGHLRAFAVGEGWKLSGGEVLVELPKEGDGVPDGLKLDVENNIYSTGPGGIWLISPSGAILALLRMPEVAANLAWGDSDARTLYITASTAVYALRCEATGHAPHRTSSRAGRGIL
jgi:gluconolactonase